MKFTDLLLTAFLNLWRRKLRTMLTVMGMVIGTTSIVVMVSLGIGMKEAMIESYSQMGSLTNITVNKWKHINDASGKNSSKEVTLDKKTVAAIKKIPGVVAVMPRVEAWATIKSGKYWANLSILAADSSTAELFGLTLAEGKYPAAKSRGSTYEIAFSHSLLDNFINPKTYERLEPGNTRVTLDSRFELTFDNSHMYSDTSIEKYDNQTPGRFYKLKPVGILQENSTEFSWYCLMDISAIERLAVENKDFITIDTKSFNEIVVKCSSPEIVKEVKATIDEMGYGTSSLQDWIDQSEKEIRKVQYLLGAIGGVSLVVAAIGIMNTMMMSIYERTKEIGIIKVLGCRMSNILALFLSEAAFIGLFGGALGTAFSYGISFVLNKFLQDSGLGSSIPFYLAFGALLFSMSVAMVSGLYPSIRAMRLSPLAAIRES